MARKHILDRELRRQLKDADQLYDDEADSSSSDAEEEKKETKRGRKFIQFAWSRIIVVEEASMDDIQEHWIRRD